MIQKPRGTEDLIEKRVKDFFALEMIIRNTVDLFNFNEIKTPIFESIDLFKRSVGEQTDVVSKEMYVFNDKKNRVLALRPEGTAPVVRAVIENKLYNSEKLPLKLFYFGQMFRYERPQSGRNRQFNQFGAEIFGAKSSIIDSELITLACMILNSIGLTDYTVHINHLVSGSNRVNYINDLKQSLKYKDLCDDCKIRIENNPLRVLDCKVDGNKFNDVIDMKIYLSEEDKKYYNDLLKNLENVSIKYIEDKKLVRGLDYYTGFVFEIKDKNNNTILGGGRYDNLVNELGNVELPAAGFAFGLERILIALEQLNIELSEPNYLDVFIISLSPKATSFSNILLLMLRNAGFKADYNYMEKGLKSAFKQSEKLNAKNVILIGDNELKDNVVIIKDQIKQTEQKVKFENIVDYLNKE